MRALIDAYAVLGESVSTYRGKPGSLKIAVLTDFFIHALFVMPLV
jgi:hypothetical protein